MTVLYIAGPMSGIEEYNYPAFRAAADDLRAAGYEVLNPVDIDHDDTEPGAQPWEWYMRRTLKMLLDADAVAVLPGWAMSRGADIEVNLATSIGMPYQSVRAWVRKSQARDA